MSKLIPLATLYRSAQFYAHAAHNLVTGNSFFSDHSFLGELYGTYEGGYDDLIERTIGLGETVNIPDITKNAAKVFADIFPEKGSAEVYFRAILAFETKIRAQIKSINADESLGTQNMIQDLADQSEKRAYKLKQRIG